MILFNARNFASLSLLLPFVFLILISLLPYCQAELIVRLATTAPPPPDLSEEITAAAGLSHLPANVITQRERETAKLEWKISPPPPPPPPWLALRNLISPPSPHTKQKPRKILLLLFIQSDQLGKKKKKF